MSRPLLTALLLAASWAHAAPVVVSHAGYLLEAGDGAVSGPVSLSFAIWSNAAPTAGESPAWTSLAVSATARGGYYEVGLGSGATGPLDTSVFTAGERWLSITVGATTLAPRVRLAPQPFALVAGHASTADSAASVANGVYSTGSYADPAWITSIAGAKVTGAVASAGNATTVTNGVYTTGSYADPSWITSIAGAKVTGPVASATTVTNGVYASGAYANPSWLTSIAGTKLSGPLAVGASVADCNATTEGQLRYDLAAKTFLGCNGTVWNTLSMTPVSTFLVSDAFTRADSSTIGNGWTDNTDTGDHVAIFSNRLRLRWASTPNEGIHSFYRPLSQHSGIKITFKWRVDAGANVDGCLPFVGVRATGANNHDSSYGVCLLYIGQSDRVDLYIYDQGTAKVGQTSVITTPAKSTDYNVEYLINAQNHLEARIWLASGARPASANVSLLNGGAPYTPAANGSNVILSATHGSTASYSVTTWVDDFEIATN